jgi:hypothetical protein
MRRLYEPCPNGYRGWLAGRFARFFWLGAGLAGTPAHPGQRRTCCLSLTRISPGSRSHLSQRGGHAMTPACRRQVSRQSPGRAPGGASVRCHIPSPRWPYDQQPRSRPFGRSRRGEVPRRALHRRVGGTTPFGGHGRRSGASSCAWPGHRTTTSYVTRRKRLLMSLTSMPLELTEPLAPRRKGHERANERAGSLRRQ